MKVKHIVLFICAVFIFIGIYSTKEQIQKTNVQEVSLSVFKEKLETVGTKGVITEKQNGYVMLQDGNTVYTTEVNPQNSPIMDYAEGSQVKYRFQPETGLFGGGFSWLFFAMLGLFVIAMISSKQRQQNHPNQQRNENKLVYEKPEVSLADVGGLNEETKIELQQVIDLFKNHQHAKELGIKKPKSALLYGPPGTGKTMIAQAIARELNAIFFAKAGSSFMEMYVGVGSSRIRELFHIARTVATEERPALIFIDEIDAIAKKRGGKNSHEERENTLNELLKELDGVENNENIFFIAATNLYDHLDEAFKRSGRISNELYIGLPEEKGRIEILDIHGKQYKLNEEVQQNYETIAKTIRGYSGADIAELYSKAAKHAFQTKKTEIDMTDVQYAIDRMVLGTQNHKLTDKDVQKRVAYHEAGHALIQAMRFPHSIRKATIIPRGGALGFVAPIPKEFDLSTYDELMDRLAMVVAGGIAEREIFGQHSIGVGGDVQQARQIIDAMVEWGILQEDFKLIYEGKEVEKIKQEIFKDAVMKSRLYIKTNLQKLHTLAQALLEKETLDGEEIQTLIET